MALTGTDRGSGGNGSSATTYAFSPGSDFTPGSFGVLCVAFDNSATGGLNPLTVQPGWNDSAGNTWRPRIALLNDPGAANAGTTLSVMTCPNVSKFTTSDTITLSFGAFSVPAKAYVWHEVTCAAGFYVEYRTGDFVTGVATANPTRTTPSITSGEMVVACMGSESAGAMTGDADSTNGSWSAQQTGTAGLGTTSNQEITSQRKVVTATATQSYDITLASSDWGIGVVILTETAIPNVMASAVRGRVAG